MRIYLSPTKLSLYKDCKRCFFDETVLRQKRPRGAFPTLPNGVDATLKKYCDEFRGSLPPELAELKEDGVLHPDISAIETYRHWREGLSTTINVAVPAPTKALPNRKITHSVQFQGSIDDMMMDSEEVHTVIDFKSKQREPVDDEWIRYYQVTMDSYAYLLEQMGMQSADHAYLWYFWPADIDRNSDRSKDHIMNMGFNHTIKRMGVDPKRIETMVNDIVAMLPDISANAVAKQPPWNPDCEYCNYRQTVTK